MADLRITHVSVLLEDGTILKDQNVDVTGGHFSRIRPGKILLRAQPVPLPVWRPEHLSRTAQTLFLIRLWTAAASFSCRVWPTATCTPASSC